MAEALNDQLKETILELEHSVWQAVIGKDSQTLSAVFDDQYIEITLEGKRVLKSEVVSQSPIVDEIDHYAISSEQIRRLGPDSVLLSYQLALEGTCRGQLLTPRDRWATSVWVHCDGVWRCAFFQQSVVDRQQHPPS